MNHKPSSQADGHADPEPSWWVGKDRPAFRAAVEAELPRMNAGTTYVPSTDRIVGAIYESK